MNRAEFQKVLAQEFYPVLRSEGFKGSGATLRRVNDPLIHVFNFQGSSTGDRCYFNLGAHLSFLPPEGGGDVAPAAFAEAHCIFRDRLEPAGDALGWTYGDSAAQTEATIAAIIAAWSQHGRTFFRRYSSYPADFETLLAEAKPDELHPRNALHFARIATHLGHLPQALAFVQSALPRVPERARTLQHELTLILRRLETA